MFFSQLETKFKDNANKTMTESEEPFRCFVKFSSTNLLESFRHCASSGMNNYIATETKGLFRKIYVQEKNTRYFLNDHRRAHFAFKNRFQRWRTNTLLLWTFWSFHSRQVHLRQPTLYITVIKSILCFIFIGIASTPVTPLLSSILLKGRNYFVITDNGPGPSS